MSKTAVGPGELLSSLLESIPLANVSFDRNDATSPACLLVLGDEIERLAMTDVTLALAAGESLVALADEIGDPRSRARARRAMAQAAAYSGRHQEALSICGEAMSIADSAGETVEAARARLASLHALATLGRFDEAIAAGVAAGNLFSSTGESELAARANLNLGAVHAMKDDPEAALIFFERARPAFMHHPAMLAQLEANRGNALAALDRYQEAEEAFAAAVAAFEAGGQPLAAAIAEGNLGFLAARRGLLQQAIRHYERARRLLEQSDAASHRARLIAEQAEVFASAGLNVEAIESFEAVIPTLDSAGLALDAGRARVAQGRSLIALDRYHDAAAVLAEAGKTLSRMGHSTEYAKSLLLEAGLALQSGNVDNARESARAALQLLSRRPADLAQATVTLARIELARHALPEAGRHIARAIEIANHLALSPVLADAHVLRGRLRRLRGENAMSDFQASVDETEKLRGTLQAEVFRSAFHADRLAPYAELLRESLLDSSTQGVATAFHAGELVKSRLLLDIVGSKSGQSDPSSVAGGTALHARAAEIRSELNWRYSRIADMTVLDETNSDRIRELERESVQLQARIGAEFDPVDSSSRVLSLDDALAAIPDGTTVLSYCNSGDEVAAFVLRDGSCSVLPRMASLTGVTAAMRRFRLQIARSRAHAGQAGKADRMLEDARRELFQLWQLLIEPIRDNIGRPGRLIVVPHGPLHMAPFSALWDGESYLLEHTEIHVVPSLSLFTAIRSTTPAVVTGASLVAGVPDSLTPNITQEVARVAAELPSSTLLLDEAASVEAVTTHAGGARVLHFACHGRFQREHPKASGLKLFDRWFTLAEISALRFPGAHVTLSACDTARASIHAGDELVGLTRAFYAAGARSLIVTLWPVIDASAVELMSDLYRNYQSGMTFAAALRAAQRHALDVTPHPAHWAPFVFGGVA